MLIVARLSPKFSFSWDEKAFNLNLSPSTPTPQPDRSIQPTVTLMERSFWRIALVGSNLLSEQVCRLFNNSCYKISFQWLKINHRNIVFYFFQLGLSSLFDWISGSGRSSSTFMLVIKTNHFYQNSSFWWKFNILMTKNPFEKRHHSNWTSSLL